MENAKKDLIIVAQSSIENIQTGAKTHTATTTGPSSPPYSQLSSASFFHHLSPLNGSVVFGNHDGRVTGTDSVVIFPSSTDQYHQETSQSKSVSPFYSTSSPTSPYVGVSERDMYPVDSKNNESSTPLTKHSVFDHEGSMIASSVLGASSTVYSQKSGGENMSRRQSSSGKNPKYKCCGCCIVELNRKRMAILGFLAILLIALTAGLAVGIPLVGKKRENELDTSLRVRETTGDEETPEISCQLIHESKKVIPYISWGETTENDRKFWSGYKCDQKMCSYWKTKYNIVPYQSWGSMPESYRPSWDHINMNCNSVVSLSNENVEAACQLIHESKKVIPYISWGETTENDRKFWSGYKCDQRMCSYWKTKYNIVPYQSWGSMPVNYRPSWDNINMNCNTVA